MSEGLQAVDFGQYRLVPAKRLLVQEGIPVPLSGRAFDILTILIERRQEVVSKDELIRLVWGQRVVEENTLAVHLSALRKALRDGRQGTRYIGTVPGRGYKFLAPVRESPGGTAVPPPEPAASGQLPLVEASLVGRDAALAAVVAALRSSPLVTLTGPGGIGKTRLALAVGERIQAEYPDGVCWIDLTSVGDVGLVVGAALKALELPIGTASPLLRLTASLKGQRRLLILDNCEQVAAGAAELAVALREAKGIRLLATSLEPLGVAGEQVERLEPLAVPATTVATPAAALEVPAVQLFVMRARAAAQDFVLEADNVGAVVRICRWLEGVPLALELAAARAALLGVEPVARRLNERLLELSAGRRDALPKHRTLRALLEWSHGLLTQAERIVLRRLSAFASGCTLEAAEAVTADTAVPIWQVAEHMASLIGKSLVIAERTALGARYRLLETTRAYAHERLVEAGELPAVMRRHADYLYVLFEQAAAELERMANDKWVTQWWPELDNLRATLDWCFAEVGSAATGIMLTAASADLWDLLGEEGRQRIDTALARLDGTTPPGMASALWHGKYWAALRQSDAEGARHAAECALELARQSGVPIRIINAAIVLAMNAGHRGCWNEADVLLQEARSLSVENNLQKMLVRIDAELGLKCILENRLDDAQTALERASKLNRIVRDDWNEISIISRYCALHAINGNFRKALEKIREITPISKELNNLELMDTQRDFQFMLAIITGDLDDAYNILINNRAYFENSLRNVGTKIRCVILHFGSKNYADAVRLYAYTGKNWPYLWRRQNLTAAIFKRIGQLLRDAVPDNLVESWSAEGENLSREQEMAVCASGIDNFIKYVESLGAAR